MDRRQIMTPSEVQEMIDEMLGAERVGGPAEEASSLDEATGMNPRKLVTLADSIINKAKQIGSSAKKLLIDPDKYAPQKDIIISDTRDIMRTSSMMLRRLGVQEDVESGGDELTEAAGKSFWDYLVGAQQSFLNDAAKAIKKIAGGYAESVKVMRSRSAVWLEYKGQDSSDMDLEVVISMIVKEPDVTIHMDAKSVMGGSWSREAHHKTGQVSTDNVVDLFLGAFGPLHVVSVARR